MRYLLLGSLAGILSLSLSVAAGERRWYVSVEGGVSDTSAGGTQIVAPGVLPGNLGLGGLLGLDDSDNTTASFDRFDAEETVTLLAALGLYVDDNLHFEAEVGRRVTDFGPTEVAQTSLMLNAAYDIPIVDALRLTLGAGAGLDWIAIDNTSTNDNGLAFAFQGSVGLAYEIVDGADLVVTYRYLVAPDAKVGALSGGAAGQALLVDVKDGAVTAGFRFASLGGLLSAVSSSSEAGPDWYVSLETGLSDTSARGVHITGTYSFQVGAPACGTFIDCAGGLTPIRDADATPPTPASPYLIFNGHDADENLTVLAAVGLRVADNMRFELEVGRRAAGFGTAEIRQTTVMINAAYDVPIIEDLVLALGAGAGLDWLELDTPIVGGSDEDFAYQLSIGLAYEIADGTDVFADYRYLEAPAAKLFTLGNGPEGWLGAAVAHDVSDRAVTLGIRFGL